MMEKEIELGNEYKYGFKDPENFSFKSKKGLNKELIIKISKLKKEPDWMLDMRLRAYEHFLKREMPKWGTDLSAIDFQDIYYYGKPEGEQAKDWDDVPEDIRNTFDRLGIPEAEKKFLAGVGAQYECLSQDTKIYTNQGLVYIKDIKKKDWVFSFDEKTNKIQKSKINAIVKKGINDVYEVIIDNKKIKATKNHPFLVLTYNKQKDKIRGRYKRQWKLLKSLKKGDLVAVSKNIPYEGKSYSLKLIKPKKIVKGKNQFIDSYPIDVSHTYNKIKLPYKTSDELMWFFGLYIGDGYIKYEKNRDKKRVNIAIPESQPELRQHLIKTIKKLFDYDVISKYEYYISINSTLLADYLIKNGFGGDVYNKRLPSWVFSLPPSQKLEFFTGFIDSDGGVRKENKYVVLNLRSANHNLVSDFRKLAILCNFHPSNIYKIKSKHPLNKEKIMMSYQIDVTGNLSTISSKHPEKNRRLKSKKNWQTFSSVKGSTFRTHTNEHIGFSKIKSIKHIGKEMVYDIEVDKYHNFIAEGLIVHNSEVVYHSLKKDLEEKGVVFLDMDGGLREYEDIVKKWYGKIIPFNDNKFAALNTAVWSGGSFIYVPPGVKVDLPLQAYFRINAENIGQFERTLIIADKGAHVHYIEGCTAPVYTTDSLHSAVVEVVALEGATVRYTTIQNWSSNVYNLVTKRAYAYKNARVEWVDGNLGSKITMKYPAIFLLGEKAHGEVISVAFAGKDQTQDAGAKILHLAPNTTSQITSKSVSKNGGRTTYRGLLKVNKGCHNIKSSVVCDALILDDKSASDTIPYMEIKEKDVTIGHEASVGRVSEEQLFYLMSRGFNEEQALGMIVRGFMDEFVRELPMEYAVELNRLIELNMEGSVG